MINKSKMWFLSISSLILILAVYYVINPLDTTSMVFKGTSDVKDVIIEESEILTAMKVTKDEDRQKNISTLQDLLFDENKSISEKNDVYEQIQYLNNINNIEEKIEKEIKKEFLINNFVQISDSNLKIVLANVDASYKYANELISFVNSKTNNEYYVTVKFE